MDGALTRMDVAFSRDLPHKIYVQHRMWDQRHDLIDWLEGGAYFYVCGDAKAMAKDVRATLVRAFADVKMISEQAAEMKHLIQLCGWAERIRTRKCRFKICYWECPPNSLVYRAYSHQRRFAGEL